MKLIDLHCDTLSKLVEESSWNLAHNQCSINLDRLQAAGSIAQLFACYTNVLDEGDYEASYEKVLRMIELLKKQSEIYSDKVAMTYSYNDFLEHQKQGRISAILTVEEGGILNGKMERLEQLREQGIRLITPMWNYENCLGYPNSNDAEIMKKGLKPFGTEVVEYMGENGMIVDVSHASDGVFWDILKFSKGSIIASHSNCRALCAHPRNLTDEMIHALAERGGVAGLNFYGRFLGGEPESCIEDMIRHVMHMIQIGGSEFPAIGTDFDGYDGMIREDISSPDQMEQLWDTLHKRGVSETQLDKIWYQNASNVLKSI